MPTKDTGDLTRRYIKKSLRGCRREQREEFLNDIIATIELLEYDYPGVAHWIERRLAGPRQFDGSEAQRILRLAIASVIGDERMRTASLTSRNVNANECSRRHRLGLDSETDPAKIVEEEDYLRRALPALMREVEALPERQRKVVRAVYYGERSQAEAARLLGMPSQTLNDTIHKATETLAVRMSHSQLEGTETDG